MNTRQEKAEESEKLGNTAAAAEPEQWGKGRGGDTLVPSQWACSVVTLHIQAAGLPRTAGVSSRLRWQDMGYFYKSSPLQRPLPPDHPSRPPWAPTTTPQLEPHTLIPWISPGAPAWLRSHVTRGHSAYFFHKPSILIFITCAALGAARQYSLTGAEIFFLAGLWGVGVIAKAVPVFQGDATGAGGSGTISVCCAHHIWDPLFLLLKVTQEKGPVLAPQVLIAANSQPSGASNKIRVLTDLKLSAW